MRVAGHPTPAPMLRQPSSLPQACANALLLLALLAAPGARALDAASAAPPAIGARLPAQADATVRELHRLSNAWDAAIVRKDRAAIAANMAEDFRQIDGDGDLADKASFVDGLMSDRLTIAPYAVEDFEVRVYGDVALLSGRTDMTGTWDGKPFRSAYRYIDIYVKRDGQWRIVSVQITRLPKPAGG